MNITLKPEMTPATVAKPNPTPDKKAKTHRKAPALRKAAIGANGSAGLASASTGPGLGSFSGLSLPNRNLEVGSDCNYRNLDTTLHNRASRYPGIPGGGRLQVQRDQKGISSVDRIIIAGGRPLNGSVSISGSKNSSLALMAAALLADGVTLLENVPLISDIFWMADVLRSVGAEIKFVSEHSLSIDARNLNPGEIPPDPAHRMRASFYVLGPLLARNGWARVPMPGGCDIGARPIDLHLKGLERLGAEFSNEPNYVEHGYVTARTEGLKGATILLRIPSAGTTYHLMTAASLAEGTTVIENAAEEPEVVDLANFLNSMGARISGAGTHSITIEGVRRLNGTQHRVIADRIEAGTYLCAGAVTRGTVQVTNCEVDNLLPVLMNLEAAGCKLEIGKTTATVYPTAELQPLEMTTMPYPGFPTDMQQPFGTICSLAAGTSIITETLYENRFKYTNELMRMGADIVVDGRTAIFRGVQRLTGAHVQATDLRSGAAMVLAGLAAEGETHVTELQYLDRGYEDMVGKLKAMGAQINRSGKSPEFLHSPGLPRRDIPRQGFRNTENS